MMPTRYTPEPLPKKTRNPEFELSWWGILDAKLDKFVEHVVENGCGNETKMPRRFEHRQAAAYAAQILEQERTFGDG
jgi:hypothetical protein